MSLIEQIKAQKNKVDQRQAWIKRQHLKERYVMNQYLYDLAVLNLLQSKLNDSKEPQEEQIISNLTISLYLAKKKINIPQPSSTRALSFFKNEPDESSSGLKCKQEDKNEPDQFSSDAEYKLEEYEQEEYEQEEYEQEEYEQEEDDALDISRRIFF